MPRPKIKRVVESVEPIEKKVPGLHNFQNEKGDWKVADGFKELEPMEAMKLLSEQKNTFGVKDVYFVDDDRSPTATLIGVRYFQTYPFYMQDEKGYFLATHCFIKS